MEKSFTLPKYWYIKITEDNKELLTQWRREVFNLTADISSFYCLFENGLGGRWGRWGSVRLLNTEEFKKYVFNPTTPTKEDMSYLVNLLKKLNIN